MSSLSYFTESSLSEEMSQFDFSTGVQSYSYSFQDRKPSTGHFQRRVITFHMLRVLLKFIMRLLLRLVIIRESGFLSVSVVLE